ncbi:uncharacterized protein LOC135447660 [Zonotrichia leucophrys gambelii]|uniref:uncharacterized protein LOC135447660 n=1 Tax=Zonotrichia leucophrys gambelii TaxID=257770 RepID=UPI0031401F99
MHCRVLLLCLFVPRLRPENESTEEEETRTTCAKQENLPFPIHPQLRREELYGLSLGNLFGKQSTLEPQRIFLHSTIQGSMDYQSRNWYFQTGTKENIVTEHQLCKTKGGWLQFDLCGETQANSAPATTFIMQRESAGLLTQGAGKTRTGFLLESGMESAKVKIWTRFLQGSGMESEKWKTRAGFQPESGVESAKGKT